jgi:beta-N-acetylhexosaminidase
VAHLFNRHLDGLYPASLSRKTVEELLRKRMGYDGVVITDDLQMGAIAKRYSLRETIRLAINAGDDILLFGNQLDPKHTVTLRKLVDITLQLVRNGEIPVSRINESNRRIEAMKRRIGIHQTNIHSTIFPTSSAI